jgi:hypothetical protein
MGQVDSAVKYYIQAPNSTIYITDTEIVFDVLKENKKENKSDNLTFTRLVFRLQFISPNNEVKFIGLDELPNKVNYFIGPKDKWIENIPTFEGVILKNIYNGIDLELSGIPATFVALKFNWVVHRDYDLNKILVKYVGIDSLDIDETGDLIVNTPFGKLINGKPKITQRISGKKDVLQCDFVIHDKNQFAFVSDSFNPRYPLTIQYNFSLFFRSKNLSRR